jgi:hypothetical protein
MNIPGYAAEESLYKSNQVYRRSNAPTLGGSPHVVAADANSDCVAVCEKNLGGALLGCLFGAVFNPAGFAVCFLGATYGYLLCTYECPAPGASGGGTGGPKQCEKCCGNWVSQGPGKPAYCTQCCPKGGEPE